MLQGGIDKVALPGPVVGRAVADRMRGDCGKWYRRAHLRQPEAIRFTPGLRTTCRAAAFDLGIGHHYHWLDHDAHDPVGIVVSHLRQIAAKVVRKGSEAGRHAGVDVATDAAGAVGHLSRWSRLFCPTVCVLPVGERLALRL